MPYSKHNFDFSSLVGNLEDPVLVVKEGRILYANHSARSKFMSPDLLNSPIEAWIHSEDLENFRNRFSGTLLSSKKIRFKGYSGSELKARVSSINLNQAGDAAEALVLSETEEANPLIKYKEILERMFTDSRYGVTLVNKEGIIVWTNPAEAAIHGYTVNELIGQKASLFSSPDRQKPLNQENLGRFGEWGRETTNTTKDGKIFDVYLRSNPVFDDNGRMAGLITFCDDISEKKEKERELRRSQLFPLYNLDPVIATDTQGTTILNVNQAAKGNFNTPKNTAELHPHLPEIIQGLAHQGGGSKVMADVPIRGKYYDVKIVCEVKENWVGIYLHDLTERRQLIHDLQTAKEELEKTVMELKTTQEQLKIEAVRDPLTGLYNRRHMEASLAREIARALRHKTALGIIMIDIDHFKILNDTYGHQAGDAALSTLGRLIKSVVREEDIACRYGGEEFILILPGMSQKDAQKRAEELRALIEGLKIQYNQQFLQITISAGVVVVVPEEKLKPEELIQSADNAMYQAKHKGRNCVVSTWEAKNDAGA